MDGLFGRIQNFALEGRRIDSNLVKILFEDIDGGTDERGVVNSSTMFTILRPGKVMNLEFNGDVVVLKLNCDDYALSVQYAHTLTVVAGRGLDDYWIEISVLSTEAEFVSCDAMVNISTKVPANFEVYGASDDRPFLIARVVFRRK